MSSNTTHPLDNTHPLDDKHPLDNLTDIFPVTFYEDDRIENENYYICTIELLVKHIKNLENTVKLQEKNIEILNNKFNKK